MAEATVPETAPEVTQEPVPEGTPAPKAEIPQTETPTPETPEPKVEPTDIDIYQDVLAKSAKDPGYDMSEAEVDAFLHVQEQIASGAIEDPGPKILEKAAEEETPTKAAKQEKEETSEDKPQPETSAGDQTDVKSDMPDSVADYLQKAMTKVGAKDISELPDKVEGLINQMKTTGGKLGGERNQLQQQIDQHNSFMQALRAKDTSAIEHLNKIVGYSLIPTQSSPQEGYKPQGSVSDIDLGDPDEYIDNKLAPVVKSLIDEVKQIKAENQKLKAKEESRDQETATQRATNAWVDDVVQLIADHPEDYGVNTSEARALAKFYWSPEGAKTAVHPKFQKIHELIDFAYKGNMPDLETAHVMWQHKNGHFAKKLIEATKNGQKEATYVESPNAAISNMQGRTKTDVPDPHITEESVTAMERGDLGAIPDEWMDDLGNLIPDKVPQRFHEQAFGRMGKPK